MIETAKNLIDIVNEIADAEDALKLLKERRDNLNAQLTQMMVDEEIQSMNVQGKLLYINSTIQASYDKSIQDKFFEVLEGHGFGAIIKPTVNARTLTATIRDLVEQSDGKLPDWLGGMVNIFTDTKINIRKA